MVNLWRNDPVPNIHESDDYLEMGEKPSTLPPVPPWVENFLQPIVIGVMVACISQSIAQLMRHMTPGWRHHFFLIAPILAALAGYATHHKIQKRFISSNESLRYQLDELVLMFLLIKISTHLNDTMPELIAHAQGWFTDPKTFFDGESILMFVLSLTAWFMAAATAKDLHTITDPTLYIGEKSPMQRISTRFFAGGIILLITTAFARVRFMELLQSDRPRVPGLILGILIYFMLGLFTLGQINYMHHTGLWHRQKVRVAEGMGLIWLRYSLFFLAVVTLIAFFLPTGYTMGLLDLVRYIFNIALFIANLVFFILSFPFLLLMSLLSKNTETEIPSMETPTAFQPPEVIASTSPNQWFEMLRSLLFWARFFQQLP